MFIRNALRILVVFTCLITPYAANAQADEQGAQQLKAAIQKWIDTAQAFNMTGEELGGMPELATNVLFEGDLIVKPSGNYYAVTLPHMKINYLGALTLDIGKIAINAAAHAPGQWKMSVATPTPIVLFSKDGQKGLEINIGGQSAAGIWDEQLLNYVKLDARYTDITATVSDKPISIKIPEIAVRYDFEKDNSNFWSGPGYVSLKNFHYEDNEQNAKADVKEVRYDFVLHKYNPAVIEEMRESLMEFTKGRMSTALTPKTLEETQAETAEMLAAFAEYFELLTQIGHGFETQYSIAGFSTSRPAIMGNGTDTIKLDKGFFGFDMKGFDSDEMSMALRLGYDKLGITPAPENSEFLPADLNFDLEITKIPFVKLIELGKNSMMGISQNPQSMQAVGLGLMFQLPSLLSQAGVEIAMKDNYARNEYYTMNNTGKFVADQTSIVGMAGSGTAVMTGIETLSDLITQKLQTANNEQAQALFKNKEALDQIKALAKTETGSDGKTKYILDYELTPAGQFMINGKNAPLGGARGARPQ